MNDDDQIGTAYERLTTALAVPPDAARLVAGRVARRRRRRRGVQAVAAAASVAALAGGVGLAAGGEPAPAPVGPSYAADTTPTAGPTTAPATAAPPTTGPGVVDCTTPAPRTNEPIDLELLRTLRSVLPAGVERWQVSVEGDQVDVAVLDQDGEVRYVLHVVDDGATYRVLRLLDCGAER